ncbi:hypothetical protein PF011_g26813 [Phytophthora fragariae]|uniref:PiggyBac transposable element-derived protein domain-containing protein n=1 Tax=Phytophthora fragariae TaxID=53985 RepID=A0A6A3HH30_9STRA|nr:hypothetical protein PF011_g26813 [Phytophthora fragariae]
MELRGALEAAPAPGVALSVAEAKVADVESAPSAEAKDADEDRAPSAEAKDADVEGAPSAEAPDAPAEDVPEAAGPAISQPVTADLAAAEVIADMVTAVVEDTATEQPGPGRNVRKRRRAILEEVSAGEDGSSGEDVAAPGFLRMPPPCVVDGDANLMDAGADKCTYLNSDEDMSVEEDREDQDSSDDGDEDEDDWDIGELTDEESDEGGDDLPESVCNSVAQSKKAIAMTRMHGWEYDPEQFGPDPSYENLFDGSYGSSESVMTVGDDPLALLFYFMPPRLWTQIAIESNRYHTQSIPLRARAIRSHQRRAGLQVENLADIRSRLARVPDIEPWEVLRVMGLLIARMLMPIRKGIAAHWSMKQVGALPTNRFNVFMTKHRFFHIMGYLHFSNNNSPSASVDRVWKIRPVVDVLQRTFARGYHAPPVVLRLI